MGLLNRLPPTWGKLFAIMAQLTTHVSLLCMRPWRAPLSQRAVVMGSPPRPRVPMPGSAPTTKPLHILQHCPFVVGGPEDLSRWRCATAKTLSSSVCPASPPTDPTDPSLSSELPRWRDRSTRLIFPLGAGCGSSQRSIPSSAYATLLPTPGSPRAQRTRSAPRPSCTWPHTCSRGRTRHMARLRSSQPSARPRDIDSSQCVWAGVCVTRMSVSKGTEHQTSRAARLLALAAERSYWKAHLPSRGLYGEPNTVKVVLGPFSDSRRMVWNSWHRYVMVSDDFKRERHLAVSSGFWLWKYCPYSA